MANTPQKIKDPTEAALSAIQDALSARDTPPEPGSVHPPSPAVAHVEEPAPEPPWRTVRTPEPATDDVLDFGGEVRPAEEPGSLRRPANDDQ